MHILSFKPGHDGTIAASSHGKLLFSLEAEKDSFPRYEKITPELLLLAASKLNVMPDCVALSGWVKGFHSVEPISGAGYYGCDESTTISSRQNFFGHQVSNFSSTHERSHIMGAYGMSPYPQGQPVYCLVWEGNLGDFYEIDENVICRRIGHVMTDPGNKYSSLFMIADPSFPLIKGHFRYEDAGKLMALSAYSDRSPLSAEEKELINDILDADGLLLQRPKSYYSSSPFFNIGVESQKFKNIAGKFSDAIFDRFLSFAKSHLTKGYPLIISGGCGLNCDWNSRWEDSGLFESVFVPPCTNDSGSAIGTLIDAQFYYTKNAKLDWNVYAGDDFIHTAVNGDEFHENLYSVENLARQLADQQIIAWANGRAEIGPRALGNRSLLASPFHPEMLQRLNKIKGREGYRPIAPLCLEEDANELFGRKTASPFMLHFNIVKDSSLKAVTHVDGSARVQTVNRKKNTALYELLLKMKELTGYGVLCNTSLNFNARGFINNTIDLKNYCVDRGVDGFVVNNKYSYTRV